MPQVCRIVLEAAKLIVLGCLDAQLQVGLVGT